MKTQNSFRATRHAPTAQCHVMQHTRNAPRLATSNEKGQQRERVVSEANTSTVENGVKLSSEAVPLHGAVRSKQRKETPQRKKAASGRWAFRFGA